VRETEYSQQKLELAIALLEHLKITGTRHALVSYQILFVLFSKKSIFLMIIMPKSCEKIHKRV